MLHCMGISPIHHAVSLFQACTTAFVVLEWWHLLVYMLSMQTSAIRIIIKQNDKVTCNYVKMYLSYVYMCRDYLQCQKQTIRVITACVCVWYDRFVMLSGSDTQLLKMVTSFIQLQDQAKYATKLYSLIELIACNCCTTKAFSMYIIIWLYYNYIVYFLSGF